MDVSALKIVGWDTETTLGYVRLLADGDGHALDTSDPRAAPMLAHVRDDDYPDDDTRIAAVPVPTLSTDALLDLLFRVGVNADYNVFWNVRFDAGAIFKPWAVGQADRWREQRRLLLGLGKERRLLAAEAAVGGRWTRERRARLAEIGRQEAALETVERFTTDRYRVLWLGKKGFRVTRQARQRRERNSAYFFDAMQFYATTLSETAPLDGMARKYLGQHKTAEDEGLDVPRLGTDPTYYDAHREAVTRYCRQDADLAARLFRRVVEAFVRVGAAFPPHPWSRASVSRETMALDGGMETTVETYQALRYSGHERLWAGSFVGACVHTRALGTWTDVTRLDKNSAYPDAERTFPSLEDAVAVSPSDPRYDSAFFRFHRVRLPPTPRRAAPSTWGGLLYALGGPPQETVLTDPDLQALDAWGDPYEIVESLGICCPSKQRPLAFMETLYDAPAPKVSKSSIKAQYGEESVEYQNVKVMLAAAYGILAQRRPRESRYTNLIYASYITALCRRDVWLQAKACEAAGGTVLAWATDGLLVADLATPPPSSKALGAWSVDPVPLLTIFGNGLRVEAGKLKRRGAPHLTVDALLSCATPTLESERNGPLGLKQAIVEGRPREAGVFSRRRHILAPARSAALAGLRLADGLLSVPLKDYFHERWLLDYQSYEQAEEMATRLEAVGKAVEIEMDE